MMTDIALERRWLRRDVERASLRVARQRVREAEQRVRRASDEASEAVTALKRARSILRSIERA
jgi:hypothetical protein